MSEKENKFILGDHNDGYRRSAGSEKTQPFNLPPQKPAASDVPQPAVRPPQRQQPVRPSQRQQPPRPSQRQQPVRPSQRQQRPGQLTRKPQQPNSAGNARTAAGRSRQQPVRQEGRVLSANEKKKLHNERRRQQRRRQQLVTYTAVCFVVLIAVTVLSLTVFFQVNEITVIGKTPYSHEQIVDACGIEMGENIILCKAGKVGKTLSKALPYIDDADVKRTISGKVTITVKTTKPKWSVINGEQSIIINSQGKVLEIAPAEKALEATILQGVAIAEAVPGEGVVLGEGVTFEFVKEIGDAADKAGLEKLTTLNLTDLDYMQVLYDGRLTIIIGSVENIEKKFALTAKVIERENEIDPDQYGTIDLTIEDKLYFRPEENPQDSGEVTEGNSDVA